VARIARNTTSDSTCVLCSQLMWYFLACALFSSSPAMHFSSSWSQRNISSCPAAEICPEHRCRRLKSCPLESDWPSVPKRKNKCRIPIYNSSGGNSSSMFSGQVPEVVSFYCTKATPPRAAIATLRLFPEGHSQRVYEGVRALGVV